MLWIVYSEQVHSGHFLKVPIKWSRMFFLNSWNLVSYPCRAGPSVGFFNPQQALTAVLAQAFVSDYTFPSRVDSVRLYLPSWSGFSLEFDAKSMISTLDPWSLSLKQNLGTVSVFASSAESSLSRIMVTRTTFVFLSSKLSVPFSPQSESRYFVIARTSRGWSSPHRIHCVVHL